MSVLAETRAAVVRAFVDSAAMVGNEPCFDAVLTAYTEAVREDQTVRIADWLEHGAPTAAKWVRCGFDGETL